MARGWLNMLLDLGDRDLAAIPGRVSDHAQRVRTLRFLGISETGWDSPGSRQRERR